jgi:transcriptional regulator with XRE-family HTH domain
MRRSVHSRAYKVLCKRLVAARHSAELSQQQLAKKLGRHQSYVAKYEGGERRIDIIELAEIASILKLDLVAVVKEVSSEI